MKDTELILFKEMIKESLRVVVKEELERFKTNIDDTIKKANSKDLKEIKALVGKQILESRKKYPTSSERVLSEEKRSRLSEVFNKANLINGNGPLSGAVNKSLPDSNPIKSVLMETARSAEFNAGDLGMGELTEEEQYMADLYPQEPTIDYGEMEDYESNVPDFTQAMGNRNR